MRGRVGQGLAAGAKGGAHPARVGVRDHGFASLRDPGVQRAVEVRRAHLGGTGYCGYTSLRLEQVVCPCQEHKHIRTGFLPLTRNINILEQVVYPCI